MQIQTKGSINPLIFDVGTVARQADGSVLVYQGDSVVLVTATVSKDVRKGTDFLPLVVDYQEMSYAAGRIPGGFIKREGRPSDLEILISRFIDRPIRPLFPEGFYNELQIIANVLSADPQVNPDVMAINGASAALHISSIPFEGPIGGVRVGRVNSEFVYDPTYIQIEQGDMELVVVGTKDAIVMVEGEAKELPEKVILDAILFAHSRIREIIDAQEELRKLSGKPKMKTVPPASDEALYNEIKNFVADGLEKVFVPGSTKQGRRDGASAIWQKVLERYADQEEERTSLVKACMERLEREVVRTLMHEKKIRVDGRGFDEIRKIECKTDILPRTHGSALFTRGETQALAITTLGTPRDEQKLENLLGETSKTFMVHYSFQPFSVGEVKPLRGPSRREIGHGNLAERALRQVLPEPGTFPYTIRLVSEILESNGSSSMASVCSGSMSLMSAGVPLGKPVAGIAMGLLHEAGEYMVLTDILGDEDHLGDMDFKVAGTSFGVTALQMDIKIEGIPENVLVDALEKARIARLKILDIMSKTIDKPSAMISHYAPRIFTIQINPEKIRDVIGPGGKVIKDITARTGTKIEIDDSGKVNVFSPDEEHARLAVEIINKLTEELEVDKVYVGKVVKIMDFGAFVDFPSGNSGLIHISQLANEKVQNVRDVVNEGDEVVVKVIGIDKNGKIRLSRKEALKQATG
jgi:polyribonucleotide nucleotidyltransferase